MIIPYIYVKYLFYVVCLVGFPVGVFVFLKLFQRFTMGRCRSPVCLNGKTAIVTGASSGIGFETALNLASRGCRVIMADKESGTRAKNRIVQLTNNSNVIFKYLDLSSLKSVRQFALEINETEESLHILINNAGVATVGNKHSEDGLHETMQINHFGPFLLTHLLVDLLKKSAPSRIIFVSSALSFFSNLSIENLNYPENHPKSIFRTVLIYGNSKLCNIIAANGFSKRLQDFGVTCNSLHPGWVNTKIMKNAQKWTGLDGLEQIILSPLSYFYAKTPREGAQTTLHLAVSNSMKEVSGKHFWDCVTFPLPPGARNEKFCQDIWAESENFVGLNEDERLTIKCDNNIEEAGDEEIAEDNIQDFEEKSEMSKVYPINLEKAEESNEFFLQRTKTKSDEDILTLDGNVDDETEEKTRC